MLGAISVWLAQKQTQVLSTKLQLTLLPTPRASVSFELLSCWLCLMVYCEEYFCKIFHSFPVTFSWASLLNSYILVIMLLFMLLSTSSSPLIMILQAKCYFELTVPNKFSSENIYLFMQLRSKKWGSFFPVGRLWSECFLLYLCLAKNKVNDITLSVLYCWGLKQFLLQKLKHSASVESLAAVVVFFSSSTTCLVNLGGYINLLNTQGKYGFATLLKWTLFLNMYNSVIYYAICCCSYCHWLELGGNGEAWLTLLVSQKLYVLVHEKFALWLTQGKEGWTFRVLWFKPLF